MDIKVKGEVITLEGTDYVLPPLPLKRIPDVKVLMTGGDPFSDPAYIDALINALHWSLLRNYPEMPRTLLEESLDMTNYSRILNAFMVTNGFVAAPTDAVLGEAQASQ